jgi:hypothetical protein
MIGRMGPRTWPASDGPAVSGWARGQPKVTPDKCTERWAILLDVYEKAGLDAPDSPMSAPNIGAMTMHGAKGLSAKVVFVPGLDEGNLPSGRQQMSPALLLESARLLFVSITRARAACILTTARSRFVNGTATQFQPSRWIATTGGVLTERGNAGLTDTEVQEILDAVAAL